MGLPDRYVVHGKPALLHEEVGFTGARDRGARSRGDLRPPVGDPGRLLKGKRPAGEAGRFGEEMLL